MLKKLLRQLKLILDLFHLEFSESLFTIWALPATTLSKTLKTSVLSTDLTNFIMTATLALRVVILDQILTTASSSLRPSRRPTKRSDLKFLPSWSPLEFQTPSFAQLLVTSMETFTRHISTGPRTPSLTLPRLVTPSQMAILNSLLLS